MQSIPIRSVSPVDADMSMSDTDGNDSTTTTHELLPRVHEPRTAADASQHGPPYDGHPPSDFYRSAASIRPVLPLPSMSSEAILELYKRQQQRQHSQDQQADENEHDPSKQLVLYQPAQPLVQLAVTGNGRRAALRRAHARNMAMNGGASGLYEWGEIGDNNAMQT